MPPSDMPAANYHRPKPVDPIWYRPRATLRINCGCGRSLDVPVGEFARLHGLDPAMQLYQLVERLRCRGCRARPTAEVVEAGR